MNSISGEGSPNFLNRAESVFVSNDIVYIASSFDNALTIFSNQQGEITYQFKLTDDDGFIIYDGTSIDKTGGMGLLLNLPLIGYLNITMLNADYNVIFDIKLTYI